VIPHKGEHSSIDDDKYVDAEHLIPHKGEHHDDVHQLSKDKWKAEYHGEEEKKPV